MEYTYEEAVEKKKDFIDKSNGSIDANDVIIAPYLQNDKDNFDNYCNYFDYNDETCKKFSSNEKYRVFVMV